MKHTLYIIAIGLLFCCGVQAESKTLETSEAVYQQGLTYYNAGNYKEAVKTFSRMQRENPKSRRAIRGWEYIAQCENKLGNDYAAFEAYQQIWDHHKNFSQLSLITRNQMAIANNFLESKYYQNAIEIFSQILANANYSADAPAAQFGLARAYLGKKDYAVAKVEFGKVIKNYPESQLVDAAAFEVGYVDYMKSEAKEYDQTASSDAIQSFRHFIHEFPSSKKAESARYYISLLRNKKAASAYRIAEYYEKINQTKSAVIMYREVIAKYPDSTYAETARVKIGSLDVAVANPIKKPEKQEEIITSIPAKKIVPPAEVVIVQPVATQIFAEVKVSKKEALEKEVVETSTVGNKPTLEERNQYVDNFFADNENKENLKEVIEEEVLRDKQQDKAWLEHKSSMLLKAKKSAKDYLDKASVSAEIAIETPVVETPAVETPVVETPVVETPVVETPVVETPVVETPVVETPVVEKPIVSVVGTLEITDEPDFEPINISEEKQELLNAKIAIEKANATKSANALKSLKEIKKETKWPTRSIPGNPKVRKGPFNNSMRKKLAHEYNIERLKKDFKVVYNLIQQGDTARKSGLFDTAKMRYGAALDSLNDIKRKAPNWEVELIDYRIRYCRDYMSKLD